MQERYLGDVHDFHKFLFLKFIKKHSFLKLGLNFYHVNPQNLGNKELLKNDGEKRKYLFDNTYKTFDKVMIKEFKNLTQKKRRKFTTFTNCTHLKKYITFYYDEMKINKREAWFKKSMEKLKDCEVIFLDPDNGLITKSINKNSVQSLKFLLFEEIINIFNANKIIVFSQSQSYSKDHRTYVQEKINQIKRYSNLTVEHPVIRNRTSPNSFFFVISNNKYFNKMNNLIKNFAQFYNKVELIDPSIFVK